MLIGELSQKAAVSKHTIRHYEEMGLIYSSERNAGSRVYHEYSQETLRRLHLIDLGKRVGLSLRQIKPLLDGFLEGALGCEEQIRILEEQKVNINEKICALNEMKQLVEHKLDVIRRVQADEEVFCGNNEGDES